MIITVAEIALFLILPLLIYYQRNKISYRKYLLNIAVVYLLWYLTYAPIHELFHWLGVWLFNKTVFDYKLIPPFWRGEFGIGYIRYNYKRDFEDCLIMILPYFKDLIFSFIGISMMKRLSKKNAFKWNCLYDFYFELSI